MKAMLQKMVIISLMPVLLCAREKRTNIADFMVKNSQLLAQKTFENDTSRTLILSYQLHDTQSDMSQPGQVLIKAGGKGVVDFKQALYALQKRSGKQRGDYEVKLWLEVATKVPFRPRTRLETRRLKLSERGIRITKNDFVSKDLIQFYKSAGGKIHYRAV